MHIKSKKNEKKFGKYKIIGKGGQGILFLSKVIAQALILSNVLNFSFLKEFDEGQRNGKIEVTFFLPLKIKNKIILIKKHNMIELRKIVKDMNLDKANVEKALYVVKPEAFKNNINIWRQGIL